jgi:hypothetical protein
MIKVNRTVVTRLWSAAVLALAAPRCSCSTRPTESILGHSGRLSFSVGLRHRLDRHAAQGASRRAGLAKSEVQGRIRKPGPGPDDVRSRQQARDLQFAYHEIYGLDPEVVRPGIDLKPSPLLHADKLHDVDFDERTARFYAPIDARKSFAQTRSLPDGQILQVTSYLRPEGGWVVIHDDVTEREQARKALELSESTQRQQNRQFQDALKPRPGLDDV